MPLAPENYVPQIAPVSAVRRRQAIITWSLTSIFALGVAALIVSSPLALASGYSNLGATIYRGFSLLCHQIPSRSFQLHEHPFAVCARCTGLYFGLAAGMVTYPLWRSLQRLDTPARGWLILALLPVGIDFLLGFTGIWENTHWSRAFTGAILGVAIAFYLVPGLVDLRFHWRSYFKNRSGVINPVATIDNAVLVVTAPSDYSKPSRRINI